MMQREAQTESTALAVNPLIMEAPLEDKMISVRFLRNCSLNIISTLLNPRKIITTEEGVLRDWRGLAELCEIPGQYIISFEKVADPTSKILQMWTEKNPTHSTIKKLLEFLETLDRYDILDDIRPYIEEDLRYHKEHPPTCTNEPILGNDNNDRSLLTRDDVERRCKGLQGPQTYNAYVLFDDADIEFATSLIVKCEKEYGFKLCVRGRDLLPGLPEIEAMIQLIEERCVRLIVIVSPEFLSSRESSTHRFYYNLAQGIAIERRRVKIVPCLYKQVDNLPSYIGMYSKLDFKRPWGQWDRLRASLKALDAAPVPSIQITKVPVDEPIERPTKLAVNCSESIPTPGLKSIIHHHSVKGNHSKHTEHVRFETIKSLSTGNIAELEADQLIVQSSSSTVNLEMNTVEVPDRHMKKNILNIKFPNFSSFTLRRKSKPNTKKMTHPTELNGVLAISEVTSNDLEMNKNHVEENSRKKDDSTTEKEKKNEKSQNANRHTQEDQVKKPGNNLMKFFKIKNPMKRKQGKKNVMVAA